MKNRNVAAVMTKAMIVGVVAGALAIGSSVKAEAQQFSLGVNVGGPVYGYGYRDGYDHERYEALVRQQAYQRQQEAYARQQAWAQHEAWERHERHEAWEHGGWDRHDGDDRGWDRR